MKTGLNSPTISKVLAHSASPHSFPDTPPKSEIKNLKILAKSHPKFSSLVKIFSQISSNTSYGLSYDFP